MQVKRAAAIGVALLGAGLAFADSATKVPDGIAGQVCDAEGVRHMKNGHGYEGPCWDPPGYRIAARMPGAAVRGRREVKASTPSPDTQVWWFEMPRAKSVGWTNCPFLPGAKEDVLHAYEPFEEGGFAPFVMEDLVELPVDAALDKLDALDLPACVTVKWTTQCSNGHGKVCTQSTSPGAAIGSTGELSLLIGSDIQDQGTPEETRRYPALVDRPLDEALADLKGRGFTNVKVVEDKVPCERGIVCDIEPGIGAQWVGTDEEIRLIVRRAKKK